MAARAEPEDRYASVRYRYYALAVMTGAYLLNFLDRQILAILQELIKHELQLSDSQLGLLTGFSFALFYIVLGLPIARWADTGVRQVIARASSGTRSRDSQRYF